MRRFFIYLIMIAAVLQASQATAIAARPGRPSSVHEAIAARTRSSIGGTVPISFKILPAKLILSPPRKGDNPPLYFRYVVSPGQDISDLVAVVNPTTATLNVKMAVSDGVTQPFGAGVTFNDTPRSQRTVGRWLRLSSYSASVPPQSARLLGIRLHIPSSVRPGEYEGAIGGTNMQEQTIQVGKRKIRVQGNVRCIVYIRVTGPATAALNISGVKATRTNKQTLLSFDVKNTGTLIAYPESVTMTLTPTNGAAGSKTFQARIGTVLGSGATTTAFSLDKSLVAAGLYQLTIRISYLARIHENGPPDTLQTTWNGPIMVPSGT